MSVEFYYVGKDGKPHGPIPLEDLRQLHRSGAVLDATLVCPVGSEAWNEYAQDPIVAGQQAAPAPVPPAAPSVPGTARAKPASSSKILLGVGIGCLAFLLLAGGGCAALFMGISSMLNDEPRKQEVADAAAALLVQNHPDVAAQIGLPLKPGYMWTGNINWSATTTYDGVMPLDGTKASSSLTFEAKKPSGGSWVFRHAILTFEGKSINLLQPAQAPSTAPPAAVEGDEGEAAPSEPETSARP